MIEQHPTHLIVGTIRKAHGIKGAVYVAPATDNVDAVFAKGRELLVGDLEGHPLDSDITLTVASGSEYKRGLIVRFDEILDRNMAEQFRDRTLLIASEEAEPLGSDEYFLHDLVGLEVRDRDGTIVGRVAEIYSVGTGHILGVDDGERERLIPFSEQVVKQVMLEEGVVIIEPPPGLLDI